MRRTLKGWLLWLHKWIGIGLGVIVFLWLVSGMLLIIPSASAPGLESTTEDYRGAVISPAQALQAVGRFDPDSSPVRKLSAVRLLGRNHYLFELANRKTFLIDMENGERLVITPEVAGAIARQVGELPSAPMTVREIRAHDAGYLRGPLPMFRVDFDDSKGTSIFVARRDGMVRYTTGALRVKNYIAGFHTFEQLELLGQQDATVKAMLHFTSVLGIVLVLSGYYLVLPRSWVRRPVQRPSSRSPAEPRR